MAVAVWLQPVFDTLDVGQVNLILMLLVIADLAFDGTKRWPTGILIGIATAIKLTPAIFIIYLLVTGRTRGAIRAAIMTVTLTVAGFVVAPSDSARFWLQGKFVDTAWMIHPIPVDDITNQSLNGALLRLFGHVPPVVSIIAGLATACVGLTVAVIAHRRGEPVAGMLACAIAGLLVSPLSWHEHWVWIVPVLMWLAVKSYAGSHGPGWLVGMFPVVPLLLFLKLWPSPMNPGTVVPTCVFGAVARVAATHHGVFIAFLSSTYVWAGLASLLAGVFFIVRQRPGTIEETSSVTPPGQGDPQSHFG